MAFWNSASTEPNRTYRWVIKFGSTVVPEMDQLSFAAKKCKKPSFKLKKTEHWYLNHKYNFPGRVEWEDIDVELASITDPNAAKVLYRVFKNAGYIFPKDVQSIQTISKEAAVKAIGGLTICQIDANGATQEEWNLVNPFLTDVDFGDLDYSSEEIVTVKFKVTYDSAALDDSLI